MPSDLEFTIDKFTFKVATDCLYSEEGLWVRVEKDYLRVGVSDFLQKRSGDVAFVEVIPVGAVFTIGDELAVIETIKVNISLSSPVTGRVVESNPRLETEAELINQEPYGAGWLAVIEPAEGEARLMNLLEPQAYLARIKVEAEREVNKDD